jgi:hypothetical protein
MGPKHFFRFRAKIITSIDTEIAASQFWLKTPCNYRIGEDRMGVGLCRKNQPGIKTMPDSLCKQRVGHLRQIS